MIRRIATLTITGLLGVVIGSQLAHHEDHQPSRDCARRTRDAIDSATFAGTYSPQDIAYYHAMKVLGTQCGARFHIAPDGTEYAE